ncbi:MAG: 3-hydroxyacyl-CoA dehydrogenase family protein, partial [Promethearchaeota archaeon]
MEVKNIVVIGVGLMGNGIAQVSLMAGYNVTLVDIAQEYIDKAVESIKGGLTKLESKGVLNAADNIARMKTNLDLASAVKDADLIIEAVIEDMDVKKNIFKTCDENAPAHAVIASNTSTMSITEMATATNRPDKCIGMHFFNPAPLMRLIEVIAGEKSSEEAMEIGMTVSASLPCLRGDRYVAKVLKDRPGFIVNRLNAPSGIYMNY